MKMILKFLISLALCVGLTSSCQDEAVENSILDKANNIITTYSSQPNYACFLVDDAITYPEPWTEEAAGMFTITEEELKNTSTCGLIQTFFSQPWNMLGPWCSRCSDLTIDGMQNFNDRVKLDVVLNELFSREDVLEILIRRYVDIIQDAGSLETHPGNLYSFEILLASENMNEILTDTVGDELMILALKMIEVKKNSTEFSSENSLAATRHIIANLLLQQQFGPFISAWRVNGSLETNLHGYKVCYSGEEVDDYAIMYLTN